MPGDYATAALIAQAELPTQLPYYGHPVRMPALKLTLLAVWAREGEVSSANDLADITGYNPQLVRFALAALLKMGVIRRRGAYNKARTYTIDRQTLDRFQPLPTKPKIIAAEDAE